jgi:hypothetical protein
MAGSRAEMALGFLLVGLVGSPQRKPVPGTNTLSRLITSCKKELKKSVAPGQKRDEMEKWLETINGLRQKRNRIVHDLMSIDQSVGEQPWGGAYAGLQEIWMWSEKQQKHRYTADDIKDITEQLRDASKYVMTWAFENLAYWKGKSTDVTKLQGSSGSELLGVANLPPYEGPVRNGRALLHCPMGDKNGHRTGYP